MGAINYYRIFDGDREYVITDSTASVSYRLYLVKKGSAKIYINGNIFKLEKGVSAFIRTDEPYIFEAQNNSLSIVGYKIGGMKVKDYYDRFLEINDNVFYLEDQAGFEKKFEEMKQIIYDLKGDKKLKKKVDLEFDTFINEIINAPKNEEYFSYIFEDSGKDKFEKIFEYISGNYMEDIGLSEISEKFEISKYYLSREFKKKYGKNISALIRELRVEKAKELIRFSDKKLAEISALCGISDTNYFIKVFKAETNMTPMEYKYYAYHKGV
ncbi:MAG: AraC family transcriptional regulator [Lachnospiraceae bacterium]|nr:AraC family transcriptional regulator [Lachnospiraceae bacterium]